MPRRSRSKRNSNNSRDHQNQDSGFNQNLTSEQYDDSARAKSSRSGRKKRKNDFTAKNDFITKNGFINSADVVEFSSRARKVDTAYSPKHTTLPLEAKTPSQQKYISAIQQNCLTFGLGPAGTGKSYCAGAIAAQALQDGQIEQIILTRPAVEAGESLGFLPGDVDEKFAAYIDAFRDILNERLGAGTVNYLLRHGRIVAAPLAFMRGKTFNHSRFVILDEAQNTTPTQMKMFLTRIGDDCKVVVNGDVKQSDIHGANGLADAVERMSGVSNVHIHEFDRGDIVRSGLVRDVIDRYEQ